MHTCRQSLTTCATWTTACRRHCASAHLTQQPAQPMLRLRMLRTGDMLCYQHHEVLAAGNVVPWALTALCCHWLALASTSRVTSWFCRTDCRLHSLVHREIKHKPATDTMRYVTQVHEMNSKRCRTNAALTGDCIACCIVWAWLLLSHAAQHAG
jgi:hypothetical protein